MILSGFSSALDELTDVASIAQLPFIPEVSAEFKVTDELVLMNHVRRIIIDNCL